MNNVNMNKDCKEMNKTLVDNFDIIGMSFLPDKVYDYDTFWSIRIIQRRKENPNLGKNSKLVRSYQVQSREELQNLKPHILKHCIDNNARAYINLNPKSWRQAAYQELKAIADIIAEERFGDLPKVLDKTIDSGAKMKLSDSYMKSWVIDVDTKDREEIDFVKDLIQGIFQSEKSSIKAEIPTVNGVHIISSPFDCKRFSDDYRLLRPHNETPEVKKDQPTLLFYQDPLTAF